MIKSLKSILFTIFFETIQYIIAHHTWPPVLCASPEAKPSEISSLWQTTLQLIAKLQVNLYRLSIAAFL